jgi:NAD(P)-dependent dehydrogenase (short-subunit alcohol dehydrogenase family)
MNKSLENKVILIVGAGGGVGSECALAAAKAGATVVLCGRSLPPLEKVYDAIVAAGGPEPALFPMDLAAAVDDNYEALAQAMRMQMGRLDAIVCAASAFSALSPLAQQTSAEWLEQFRVNAVAPFLLTQACAGLMRQQNDAPIILLGEQHGRDAKAYWGGFAVSQAALDAWFRIQADEWSKEPALRLHLLIPGPIRSPMRNRTHPGEDRNALPTPTELAADILRLLGEEGRQWRGERLEWRPGMFAPV